MVRIETSRFREVLGLQIGTIRETAQRMNLNHDLHELESEVATLEQAVSELKGTLTSIPHEEK